MSTLPFYLPVLFLSVVVMLFAGWYRAAASWKVLLIVAGLWAGLQTVLGLTGFYQVVTQPPRIILLTAPPLVAVGSLFVFGGGRRWIDALDLRVLTLLHGLRIFVELVLFGLFVNHAIPRVMTFEGGNLDILSGLSAPVVYYFGFKEGVARRRFLLLWNLVCLALLLNVVVKAMLSLLGPVQNPGLDQPKIAILYFPYLLLPGLVVPLVMFAHFVAFRQLLFAPRSLPGKLPANAA